MNPPALRAAVVTIALVVVQAGAFALQVARGYRPFVAAPTGRVPFSWDMFALRIDRCDVQWSPPLTVGGKPFASLARDGRRLEWTLVRNRAADYPALALAACRFRSAPSTRIVVRCALAEGRLAEETLACP